MVTFAGVPAPHHRLGAAISGKSTEFLEGYTGVTPPTLDGTTAPQGGRAANSGTSTQRLTTVAGTEAGNPSFAATDAGDRALDLPAPENPATCLVGLLLETGKGSHEAFEEFYRRTSRRVFGIVRRVVLDPGLSEEVTQEVFIVVWRDASRYDPGLGSPTAWVLMIAHRKAVDKVRSHQSSTSRDGRWASLSWARPYDEVGTFVLDQMDALHLRDSLAILSPLQREAIVLAYFGSLTYREVAERLSKPLPTIKSRIREGLKQLREQLDPA